MTKKNISQKLANKTFKELGLDPKTAKPLPVNSRNTPVSSHNSSVNPPFRIPALEKTKRQAKSTQGYKASAAWQTASLLRDLILVWTPTLSRKFPYTPANSHSKINPGTIARLRTQIEDAARSTVANIEEGWARPSTKEYLDFLGFSQASLAEVRGDIERMHTDNLIKTSKTKVDIPTPSRNNPYPPLSSRKFPSKYGKLRERLREYMGREIKPEFLSYDLFIELVNKTDYLLTKSVNGLRNKIVKDEKEKLKSTINAHWRKHW